MSEIWAWIKEHPYITGGSVFALVVLYLVVKSAGNAASQQAAVSANPGGVSDAVYTAELAANAQSTQAAAAAQVQQAQVAGQLQVAADTQESTDAQTSAQQAVALQTILSQAQTAQYGAAAQLAAAQSGNAAQVAIANTSAASQVGVATIQGQTAVQQAADALAATQSTNATSYGVAQLQAGVVNNQTSAALALGSLQSNNQLELGEDTNAAQVSENDVNNATQNNYINTVGSVDLSQILAQYGLDTQGIDLETQQLNDTQNLIDSGVFNKGGEGGLNQLAAFEAGIGSPAATTASAAAGGVGVTQAQGGSVASIFSSLAKGIGTGITFGANGLFGSLPTGAASLPTAAQSPAANGLGTAPLPTSAPAAPPVTPVVTSTFTPGAAV